MQVLLDPVNMSTNRTTYNTTDFLNATFDLLGDCIIAAHAKDVGIQTRHWVLQLDEVPIGTGHLDYETFLRRVDQLEGEIIRTIEPDTATSRCPARLSRPTSPTWTASWKTRARGPTSRKSDRKSVV